MRKIRSDEPSLRPSCSALPLRQRLALFANELIAASWEGDVDTLDVQTLAEKYGLIREVGFDPRRHDDHYGLGVERGDPWYTRVGGFTRAVRLARKAQKATHDGSSKQTPQDPNHGR